MSVSEELKRIVTDIKLKTGLKQAEIADKLGVKSTYFSDMINGRVPFSENIRSLIYEIFQINNTGQKNNNLIPFYDDVSTIGGVNEVSANTDGASRPTDYIDTGDWFKDATAALRHYGDSMVEYPPGCILALKEVKERGLMVWGRDYVIETNEYRITKRAQRGKGFDGITAYSTNMDTYPDGRQVHEPIDIKWSDIRSISLVLGYVVKKNGGTMVFSNKK